MRAFILVLAAITALAAGCVDLDGITANLDFASESLEVDIVQCFDDAGLAVDTLLVGETALCDAWNEAGTRLVASGISTVVWESSDPAVLEANVEGLFTARDSGSARAIGKGANGSSGSWQIEVR